MAAFTKEATNYVVALHPQTGGSGRIIFTCREGFRLFVNFKSGTLPPNTYDPASKVGTAHAQIDQFPFYVDLARNEKPVFVMFNPDAAPPTYSVHANEPTGEGEI